MLNYSVVYKGGIICLLIIIGLKVFSIYPVPLWALFVPLLLLPLFAWGAVNIRSGFYMKVISQAPTNDKVVALSFDDGPQVNYTPVILDILKSNKVSAAFFCIGKNISGNENILQRIYEEGHMLGNHTYSHDYWFDLYNAKKMQADMQAMTRITHDVTGKSPRLFRPPYGVTNPNLSKAVRLCNYLPVGWNIRSLDTIAKNKKRLLNRILKQLKPGAVILLHDTCKITADILPQLISAIRQQGYQLERMDKMLKVAAYA